MENDWEIISKKEEVIAFTINGERYTVDRDKIPISTSLNTFLRNHANLRGTKFMCLEGGCGVCIITLKGIHPITKQKRIWAANSCLWPVYSCQGLEITTIEGVGNKKDGCHPIQNRLYQLNGTQCGYCSPAMVMNMYSLLEGKNGKLTMEEIENSFGGNICRCTGYRPILDAFKSLAADADEKLIKACMDIEDITKTCPKTGSPCGGMCKEIPKIPLHLTSIDCEKEWHKVYDLESLFNVLEKSFFRPYMLVGGNTAHGVYRRSEDIELFIDVNDVDVLRSHSIGIELVIGANVNLTETMAILQNAANTSGFSYCKELAKHIDLVANVPVRNCGTIAGNLSIKHEHKEFPSDIFIILEGCGAKLTIAESQFSTSTVSVADYLRIDMTKKVILNVKFPRLDPQIYKFRTYKIMPRAQNAHAYVNAAFLFKFNGDNVESARICFGGIAPTFIHATKTENLLKGKNLYSNETLQSALVSLNSEIIPDWVLPDACPEYRKNLAISLFYKFALNTAPADKIKSEYKTGGDILERPLSSGIQSFDTYEDKYPLTKPVTKYEGLIQVCGEAQYTNDIPCLEKELCAAFVRATEIGAKIGRIDACDALDIPGVRHFFSAKDIPGKNSFAVTDVFFLVEEEQIFVSENNSVEFHGQPVGVILADTFALANLAALKVRITYYKKETQVIPTIKDAFDMNVQHLLSGPTKETKALYYGTNATKKLTGTYQIGGQFHFSMEPQTTVCVPAEFGMDVYSATQWMDLPNIAIAQCLKVPESSINMIVRRVGGGFGGKISRPSQIACTAALACHLTNRPVRFVMTIESNMAVCGKRYGLVSEYEVDVDDNGKIQKLKNKFMQDAGCSLNEEPFAFTLPFFSNCYSSSSWENQGKFVRTTAPSNTWCRAPGSLEGIAMIEDIMEHIARVTGKDPISVRMANMDDSSIMKTMMIDFLKDIDFTARKQKVDDFNQKNRWRKRGIAVVPMKFPLDYFGSYPAYVCIYHYDGTVAVSHGGIEMGQGINTKVVQVVAHTLGIPCELIRVKASNNVIGANAFTTGGSLTSETVCFAVKKACEELCNRLKPLRDQMKDAKWSEITHAAYNQYIDLSAKYTYKAPDVERYDIWGLSCAEIETDILTGNMQIRRVDILEDTGESMSPLVDVGQVEGAFVMGIGYFLSEGLVYDRKNGELLTNRTWNYKPPGAKDIPIDFRIKFLSKSSNPCGVLRSKATGEPAICMAIVVVFALRYALESARKDAGITEPWFNLGSAVTPEVTFLNSGNSFAAYKY